MDNNINEDSFDWFFKEINSKIIFNKFINDFKKEASYDNKVFNIIDNIVIDEETSNQFITTIDKNSVFYRARKIDINDYHKSNKGLKINKDNENYYYTNGYNELNSIEPPLGISVEGRNNISGSSYLYVAEDIETACAEIKTNAADFISLAKFEVQKPLKIVDFCNEKAFEKYYSEKYNMSLGMFFTLLMFQYTKPITNPEEYKITQFISDYIRKAGFDGVSYRSFYTGKTNYTIFNCHKKNIKFVDSKILLHRLSRKIYWDFDNKKTLFATKIKDEEFDFDSAKDMLKDLYDIMKK